MSKKYTIDQAGPFLARVASRVAAIEQAEKELSTIVGEGIDELGPTFQHEGQEYAIRFYTKKGKYTLCKFATRVGAHLRPRVGKADLAEMEDLCLPENEKVIETNLLVGEDLLDDPVYGTPDNPTNTMVI